MKLSAVKPLLLGKNLFLEIKGQNDGFYSWNFSVLRFNVVQFSRCHTSREQPPNISHGQPVPVWTCASPGSPSSLLSLESCPIVQGKQSHFLF